MHYDIAQPPSPQHHWPAWVLAFVLLGGLSVAGWLGVRYLHTLPDIALGSNARTAAQLHPLTPQSATALQRQRSQQEGPRWRELTTSQRHALAPLAERWRWLSEAQKRHWLHLSAGFDALPQKEQQRMQTRMADWANLSAQQRSMARLNYATTQALAPNDKRAQWEAYQALSEEERHRLAAEAAPQPAGAATAVRPVPTKRLVRVPAANKSLAHIANPPKILPPADYHTPQALPTPAAEAAVETTPIPSPSAIAQPLPTLQALENDPNSTVPQPAIQPEPVTLEPVAPIITESGSLFGTH